MWQFSLQLPLLPIGDPFCDVIPLTAHMTVSAYLSAVMHGCPCLSAYQTVHIGMVVVFIKYKKKQHPFCVRLKIWPDEGVGETVFGNAFTMLPVHEVLSM